MAKPLPILRHIINHMGVAVASKFVPLASIFIYSRYMTVYDYGVVNLYASYLWIFAIAMSFNLHTSIGRHIYNQDGQFSAFLGTTLIAVCIVYVTISSAILFNLKYVSGLLNLPEVVIFLIMASVLGQIGESLLTQITIFHHQSALLLKVIVAKAFATFAVGMALLWTLRTDKYLAVLYAESLTSVLLVAFVIRKVSGTAKWSFSMEHLRHIGSYSIPLIPYMLSLTLLSQFDRVLIDRFFGKEATGLYALSYNIGMLLLMVVTAVLNTFNPAFFSALNGKNFSTMISDSRNTFALAVLVTGTLVLFGQEFATLIAPAKYAEGFHLIPIVALGGLCFVIFQIWVRVLAYYNRTGWISMVAIVATAVNIGLNFWLLPVTGYQTAAWTTVAAYLIMSFGCIAVLNYVVGAFSVNISSELTYVIAMATLAVVSGHLPVDSSGTSVLKALLLCLLAWHLRGRLAQLMRSAPPI